MARELRIMPDHIQIQDVLDLEADGYQIISIDGFKNVQEALDWPGEALLHIQVEDAALTDPNRITLKVLELTWWPVLAKDEEQTRDWCLGYFDDSISPGVILPKAIINRLPSGQYSWTLFNVAPYYVGGVEPNQDWAMKIAYARYMEGTKNEG